MARKTNPVAIQPLEDATIDQNAVADAMLAMREQAQEDDAHVFDIGQRVGALQATRMWRTACRAAELKMFAELRALPMEVVQRIPLRVDGLIRRAERAHEFCELVFGRSYSKLAEDAQNLDALGEEVYDLATRLGINRAAMRATRALPPDKLEVVRAAIGNGSTKAEVMAVIEDLAEKVKCAEEQLENERQEREADRQVSAKKTERIEGLERKLVRIERQSPDEQMVQLKREAAAIAADAEAAVLGGLRQALIAIDRHGAERGLHDVYLAGLVGQVQARLNDLRDEFGLPDVSRAADAALAAEVAQWAG